jgi:hypothetical protein
VKVKVSSLSGAQLDWAVGTILYPNTVVIKNGFILIKDTYGTSSFAPSLRWKDAGMLIEAHKIELFYASSTGIWTAKLNDIFYNDTMVLRAAMRCLVKEHYGEEVIIPIILISELSNVCNEI